VGFVAGLALLLLFVLICIATERGRDFMRSIYTRSRGRHTIDDRLAQYGELARRRLKPFFETAAVPYPPARVTLAAFKEERRLEVYAGQTVRNLRFIRDYEILGASGQPGPKLREGDRQVPEGLYGIESLNPNSRFHLSLRINYPNEFDRRKAASDGRANLGGDIMIHGGSASIGCLAMGDAVAEELFVLAADVGVENLTVILTPVDFRRTDQVPAVPGAPPWVDELYSGLSGAVRELPPR
jgi:hypothetical protein